MIQKYNAVIVDDEAGSIATLEMLLERYCPVINIQASFMNPLEAIDSITVLKPDILFLDIEMPFANAFDLLDKLAPVHFEVIFVTAFNNYALRAIKYAAVDYILKPVNIDDLLFAVDRAEKQMQLRQLNSGNVRVHGLLQNLKEPDVGSHLITLPTKNGFEIEEARNILYLEASGSYTLIVLKSGKSTLVSKGMKDFEEILINDDFIRIHHSYIVNIRYVKEYFRGRGGTVQMVNGKEIEVAARKKQEFLNRFGL